MTSWLKTLTMGCLCGKETIAVHNQKLIVLSHLGEGGFSTIDLVEDRHSHRLFALKRMTCHSQEDEQNAVKEADLMNSVNHRNLVPCHSHTVVPLSNRSTAISEVLIVMPYYKKGSVYDELMLLRRQSRHMSEARVLHLMSGLCDAVNVLHASTPPLAHRDIKPHNIMLDDEDEGRQDVPVLMDFGSMGPARIDIKGTSEAQSLQDFAAERCSMPYRAPELFHVESYCKIDERVDIWSLGCTLYAMCFYESPFDSVYQRGDSVALAVMAGNIKIPSNSQYSAGLLELIKLMLTVDPLARPAITTAISHLHRLEPGNSMPSDNRV